MTTKATLLIFCLEEFNHLFQTTINVQAVLNVLKASMQSGTSNVNVADRIMPRIVDTVFEECDKRQFNEEGCKVFKFGSAPDQFGFARGGDVCYKEGEKLIISLSVLVAIIDKQGFGSSDTVRKLLHTAGYTTDVSILQQAPKQRNKLVFAE